MLDTDVMVDLLRGKDPVPHSILSDGVIVSIISKAELLYGAHKSERVEKNLDNVVNLFRDWEISVVTLEDSIIDIFAKLKTRLEKEGKRLDDFDLLIAATALAFDLELVTRNTKHFARIPRLKLKPPEEFPA